MVFGDSCLTFGGTARRGSVSAPFHLPLAMCQGSCCFPSPGLVVFFQGFFPGLRGHPCFGLSSSPPPPSTGCLSLATLTLVGLVWTQALKDRVHADVQGGRKETPAQGSACSAVGSALLLPPRLGEACARCHCSDMVESSPARAWGRRVSDAVAWAPPLQPPKQALVG